MARNHDGDPESGASRAERILAFRLEASLYAIRVMDTGGVLNCATVRALPGAPPGVLGLSEWRGSVLTVLDLPGYLGCAPRDEPACLIRLAAPLDQTVLYLPATVRLAERRLEHRKPDAEGEAAPAWLCGDEPVALLDPRDVVRSVEREMRERN